MRIGEKIRKLRKERGLSQQKLADEIDAYQSNVYLWEKGKAKPRKRSIEKICSALKITLTEFEKGVDSVDIR